VYIAGVDLPAAIGIPSRL